MPHLALHLLGPFQAMLAERPITGLESNKVRALLAYLAVEAGWPHPRDEIVGLLWPDRPDVTAHNNLRQALANLRNAIGDRTASAPFLSISSDSIQFQPTEQCSIDVAIFGELIAACRTHAHRHLETCRSCAQRLQQAVELYRGDFLAQFVQSGSEAYEEWALIQRERLHREALEALYHLTQHFEWRGDHARALQYAQRQLELDPWHEEAHRQAMRALALTEQRSAALAQYETCRRVLAQELGAEPAEETTALYEQIKAGAMAAGIQPWPWLTPATPLIGREAELAEANAIWRQARTGEGQVLLIGGEPGIGKTRLMHELIAQERYGNANILLGECYAEGSAPFAPIAQVLQAAIDLAGFPRPSSSGVKRAGNLPGLSNSVIADLITFVPALRDRFPDVPPNLPLEPQAEQQRRFESIASFLMNLAARAPVLLIIEDVHWADSATLALLRHIARRLRRTKLLIVAAHREVDPDETRLFHEWLSDLQDERLASSINLARLDKDDIRDLLAALFREAITPEFLDGIYDATEGNPFFVTEICRALIDEGAVIRAGESWKRLSMAQIQIPPSVRLAIQRRIDRLPETAQDTLQRAAVLGREFEFDALQAMSEFAEEALIEALETAERAQLVHEVARASHTARVKFAFAHALIPSTLHDALSSLRRQRLHHRAAQVIEHIAQQTDRTVDLAAQLAQHYTEAGEIGKAVDYWLQAGDHGRSVYAYDEAIGHYRQALAFLKDSGPGELVRAARTAMTLGGLYHSVLNFEQAQRAYDEAFDLWQRASDTPLPMLPPAPHALRSYWWDDIGTLDLTQSNRAYGDPIVAQLFSGLIELTPDFDLVPLLAHRWEILDGGRRYVFHLRRDARWSDGQPVTACDFEYAWRRILDPATRSPNAEFLYPIKHAPAVHHGEAPPDRLGFHTPDDFTLVVDLEEPTGYFLQLLACYVTFAIPRHIVSAYGVAWCEIEHLVTNGPFRLAEWIRGDKLILTRDPNYRGRSSGNLACVELTLMPFEKRSLDSYKADEHDICDIEGPDWMLQVRQQRPGERVSAPMAQTHCIGFDTTQPPFDAAYVRQAFVHVVDRKTLCEVVLNNAMTPATGGFVPPGLPGHSPHIGLAYDPERARHLLAEAGYPRGHGFPVIEAWTLDDVEVPVLRYLQAQWREQLGIDITWQTFERSVPLEPRANHTPHLFTAEWFADYPDPDNFLRVGLHHQHRRWHNEQYEQLLDSARRISDPVERLKFYQAADRLLVEEAGIMPLYHDRWHFLIKPWVKRYPISAVNVNYWKDVIIEPH